LDKRSNNGGHSTKTAGVDKRKNVYRDALTNALDTDDIEKVFKMLFSKATKDDDTAAAKILLEYYLGKPTQTIEQTNLNIEDKQITPEELDTIKDRFFKDY
jgi:hypothetical protein